MVRRPARPHDGRRVSLRSTRRAGGHYVVPAGVRGASGRAARNRRVRTAGAAILFMLCVAPAFAQVDGHASVIVDVLPDISPAGGAQAVGEMRIRIFAERRDEVGSHLRINLAGYVDGLLADRSNSGGRRTAADVIVRPADLYVDAVTDRFDLRV